MGKSTTGFALGLVGGILGVIFNVLVTGVPPSVFCQTPFEEELGMPRFTCPQPGLFERLYPFFFVLGIIGINLSGFIIWFSTWMRDPKKCKSGGILTLIFSAVNGIVGSFGICLGLFGHLGVISNIGIVGASLLSAIASGGIFGIIGGILGIVKGSRGGE